MDADQISTCQLAFGPSGFSGWPSWGDAGQVL